MLEIKEINKSEIPEFVWERIATNDKKDIFEAFYKSEGMFGSKSDYLLALNFDGDRAYGFVYNGNAPDFSEFGSFGLNESKTERIW